MWGGLELLDLEMTNNVPAIMVSLHFASIVYFVFNKNIETVKENIRYSLMAAVPSSIFVLSSLAWKYLYLMSDKINNLKQYSIVILLLVLAVLVMYIAIALIGIILCYLMNKVKIDLKGFIGRFKN